MPELPEIETIRSDLSKKCVGLQVSDVRVSDKHVLNGFSPNGKPRRQVEPMVFSNQCIGKHVGKFERRGKYLIMEYTDQSSLIFHLRMTGQLTWTTPKGIERFTMSFGESGTLCFSDRRRLGEVIYSQDWKNEPSLKSLGMEPLSVDMTPKKLYQDFKNRTAPIHSLLLNQRIISGLGNIYAAEALHLAGIHPRRQAGKISFQKMHQLLSSIQNVLKNSILTRGFSMNTYVDAFGQKGKSQEHSLVYGREGHPCKKCGSVLTKIALGGRGVVYCRKCQR